MDTQHETHDETQHQDQHDETGPRGFWAAGRHPVSVGHLVVGLAFLGLVAVWALVRADAVQAADVRWLLPVPFLAAGAAVLLATTLAGARSARRAAGDPIHPTGADR